MKDVQGNIPTGVIHQSACGCQYCCHEYLALLATHGMVSSMTDADHCYQNAIAERINGILQDEFNLDAVFANVNQAHQATAQSVEVYKPIRTQWSMGGV